MSDTYQAPATARISRISVGRVYNLGNYEHIRYELTVDVPDGASAANAIRGVEKIIDLLKPDRITKSRRELAAARERIEEMKTMPLAEFECRIGSGVAGGPAGYIKRCEESLREEEAKSVAAEAQALLARQLFDDLGGAASFKDAKLSWDDNCGGDFE